MQNLAVKKRVDLSAVTQSEFNAQLITLWLSHNKSSHTKRVYARDIKEFLTFVGDRHLGEVTFMDVQEFRENLASGELAPRTINRKIHALRSLLTFGCEKVRMLTTNVGVVLGSEKVKNDLAQRILTEEQVFTMLAKETDKRNALILRVLYYCGLRVSELTDLKWKDLQDRGNDEGQAVIFGKGGKTRVILVPRKIWRSLLNTRGTAGNNDPVFTSQKGGALDPSQVFRIVKAAGDRAGIEGVSPHWLRHSHASHSMDRGAPLHVVQASLGHSNPATTGKYLHARPGDGSGRYLG